MKARILAIPSAVLRTSLVILALLPPPSALAQVSSNTQPANSASTTYVVKSGDTWWDLASRYGVSISRLLETNDVQAAFGVGGMGGNDLWLYPGQQVTIPVNLGHTPSLVNPFLYTVNTGETLPQIAYRFEQSLFHLRLANGLDPQTDTVKPGTTLLMPAGPHYHRLGADETLADVAAMYGVTQDYLLRFNNSAIAPGQDILIPIQYDRPFTPMSGSPAAEETVASETSIESAASSDATMGIAGEGETLEFRWFGVNTATPDAAAGRVALVLVAEFRGGVAPFSLTIGDQDIPARGPYLKQDGEETWTNLEFDWQTNCNDAFPLPGTLTSADGQSAFMANTIGPFSCD